MKFEDFKRLLDLAKLGLDSVVSVSDWRARRRVEERKARDDEKDRRIRELEKELAALKKVAPPEPETEDEEEDDEDEETE